ncbi:hypothetical protein GF325_11070 [Candidatus Bathyarchaeota archaeon]|nr:hypothetical protein [Candidatus Bathyarchaeota archaeon]
MVVQFKFALTIFHSRENSSKSLSLVQVAFFVLNASLIIADALIAIFHLKVNEGMGSIPRLPPVLLLVQEIIITLPFLYMFVMAWKLSKKAGDPNDEKALLFIAISGLLKFGSYMSMLVNDFIGFRNPWSIGIWSCALAAFMTFYIGVTRPAILFKKSTGK